MLRIMARLAFEFLSFCCTSTKMSKPTHSSDTGYDLTIQIFMKFFHGINAHVKANGSTPSSITVDIVTFSRNVDGLSIEDPYLVTLALIKLRIIASHDAISRTIDFAFKKTNLTRIQEEQSLVQDMLVSNGISSQREQVDRLLENANPITLYTMYNFEGTFERERSPAWTDLTNVHPCPWPINFMLSNGVRAFFRVPGAADVLRACGRGRLRYERNLRRKLKPSWLWYLDQQQLVISHRKML